MFCGTSDSNDKFGNAYLFDDQPSSITSNVMDGIRMQLENWDNADWIVFIQSTSGGTGSGLSSCLLSWLDSEYENKLK